MKKIRLATPEDSKAILDIYSPFILNTTISFEQVVPELSEFTQRIIDTLTDFPYLVYQEDDEILGYAYAGKHAQRYSYLYSANVSIYINENHHSKGVGKALYTTLFDILTQLGYFSAFSAITSTNEKSSGLHKYFEFEQVGYFKKVGYKFDSWLDLIWLQKSLNDYNGEILPLKSMQDINFKEIIIE